MRIFHVVSSQREVILSTPVLRAIERAGFASQRLVALGGAEEAKSRYLAAPDLCLGIDLAAADAPSRVMEAIDALCADETPDLLVVAGASDAILSAVFAASRRGVRVAKLEAGARAPASAATARSGALIDRLADLLFTSSAERDAALGREQIPAARIHRVGSLLVDAVIEALPAACALATPSWLGLRPGQYALAALAEADGGCSLGGFDRFVDAVEALQRRLPVVVILSRAIDEQITGTDLADRLRALPNVFPWQRADPLERLDLLAGARFILTNTALLQEVTSGLGIPCLTLAPDVARSVTLTEGSNYLVGLDPVAIDRAAEGLLRNGGKTGRRPRLWDGRAGERITEVVGALADALQAGRTLTPLERGETARLRRVLDGEEVTRTDPRVRSFG